MKKLISAALVLCMAAALCGCSANLNFSGVSPFRNLRDEGLISSLDACFDDFTAQSGAPVSVGVIKNRETRFMSRGMDEHTVQPVGTLGTAFAGMLASNLEILRYIGCDEYVSDWLRAPVPVPELDGERVKVWQLACNVSGLGDVDAYGKDYFTSGMMYNQLENCGYMFDIGDDYYESALGSALLGECLRQSYNMNADYVNLVNNQVLSKMELNDSSFKNRDALACFNGFRSTSYDLLKVAGYCGGMLTVDENLTKTVEGALDEKWSDGDTALSMSFNIDKSGEHVVYFKSGTVDGGEAFIAFCPDLGTGVSVVAQEDCDAAGLGRAMLEIISA